MEVLRMLQVRTLIGYVPHTDLIPSETKIESDLSSYSCRALLVVLILP